MRLFLILALALWSAVPAFATVAQYEVRGVRSNDVLNIRAAPTHTARIVGRIPPNGREIEIIAPGRGQWVKISYRRVQGFVNRRFLALSKRRVAEAAATAAPAAAEAAPAETPAIEDQPAAVAIDPQALETPTPVEPVAPAPVVEPAPAVVAAPSAPPVPAPPVPAAPVASAPKLAAPAVPDTELPGAKSETGETPSLMKPPAEMMPETVYKLPSRLTCSGVQPFWSMTTGGNVGEFETREGEKLRLEFAALEPATGRNAVWMAQGRTAESRLNLHLAETGTCRSGASDQQSRYEVTLRLNDGRLLNGCCQAAN